MKLSSTAGLVGFLLALSGLEPSVAAVQEAPAPGKPADSTIDARLLRIGDALRAREAGSSIEFETPVTVAAMFLNSAPSFRNSVGGWRNNFPYWVNSGRFYNTGPHFLNNINGFRNSTSGWRNAIPGWLNGGGFRNSGFANGGGNGFRNAGFGNGGGFHNGGFRNGGFRNS